MKNHIKIGMNDANAGGPAKLEIAVPHGTTRADLGAILQKVLPNIEKLRPRGCSGCLSGLDINIREQFEHVLTLDV